MKIALVILHADAARGGAERYTLDLAKALVERGHEVSILASSFQYQPSAGERVLLSPNASTRIGRYLSFMDALDRELDEKKYDIVHAMLPVRRCDVYHPHAGIAAEAMSVGHRTKATSVERATAWLANRLNARRRKFAVVEQWLLGSKHPPVVLCLSKMIEAVLIRHYPHYPAEKRVALFNGIDLHRFDPQSDPLARARIRRDLNISDAKIVGLLLAQDFERKGVRQTIEALALIKNPELMLVVGGRPDPSKYRRLAASLGVEDRVIFAGPVKDPVAFYMAADFFVLPTRSDPCSLVVLEALAMGLPVISTVKNGACEIMVDGVHGAILKNPEDISALSEAIKVMGDSSLYKQMSFACRKLRDSLSQAHHVGRLGVLYDQLAAESPQRKSLLP